MRNKILSSLFLVATLGVAAPAFAQSAGTVDRSTDTQYRDSNDNNTTTDHSGLWGLVGLLGGLGLLGMRRKHEEVNVRRTAPAPGYTS